MSYAEVNWTDTEIGLGVDRDQDPQRTPRGTLWRFSQLPFRQADENGKMADAGGPRRHPPTRHVRHWVFSLASQ
jgi:hypothetical protein